MVKRYESIGYETGSASAGGRVTPVTDRSVQSSAPADRSAVVPPQPSVGSPAQVSTRKVLTTIEKTQRLKFALAGDACNAIYLNLATAGSVLLLFMERIGLHKAQMGVLLAALGFGPMIAPIASQIGARLGFKRIWLIFATLRVFLLAGLIFSPHIAQTKGPMAAFAYVAAVLVAFSLCRSTADSQGGPWSMDYVPPIIRGKYTAIQLILTMTCGATSIFAVGWLLGDTAPLQRFQWFFTVAILFGFLPVLMYSKVPGGEAQPSTKISLSGILQPLRDKTYRRHLFGHMMVNFGWFATVPFVPLYMKHFVGLKPDQIVTLDAIGMIGSLCSSFLWGWAADRYGGKPVMVSLLSLHVVYPLGMLFMPQHSEWSHLCAMALIFFHGFIGIGWVIGFYRYFFINLVPNGPHRTAYIALNTAMGGLMVGSGPLWAGWVLERLSNLGGTIGPITITPHTPFFVGLIGCVLIATWLMGGVPARGAMATRQFASMILQGNLLATVPGLVAFRLAGLEEKRINIVSKLGTSRSPWSVEELIEALDDPSFGVRYEAIVSVTRTLRDPRLTDALIKVVRAADPGLQMAAVWALGRIDDDRALPTLRTLLDSPYRTLRAQVARALGMLNDVESADRLMSMFRSEKDQAVRVAIGSALASLGRLDTAPGLLELLRDLGADTSADDIPADTRRREVSLAIATLLGRDDQALRLWRRMHDYPGDTLGGTMLALRSRLTASHAAKNDPIELRKQVERSAYAFAADDLAGGTTLLLQILDSVHPESFTAEAWCVLTECRAALQNFGITRREYVLLAVHALHVGFAHLKNNPTTLL